MLEKKCIKKNRFLVQSLGDELGKSLLAPLRDLLRVKRRNSDSDKRDVEFWSPNSIDFDPWSFPYEKKKDFVRELGKKLHWEKRQIQDSISRLQKKKNFS